MSSGINGPPILYNPFYEYLLKNNVCQNPDKFSEKHKQICELYYKKNRSFFEQRNNKCDITKEDYDNDLKSIQLIKKK